MSLHQAREHLRFANSFNRLRKLLDLVGNVSPEDWLTVLGEEWSGCDDVAHWHEELWDSPFAWAADDPSARPFLMNDSERAALAALPDEVELFRGCYQVNKWGLSWSLDRATAARFPALHRYKQEGQALLIRARIRRLDIIALKLCRDEAEVIAYRPKHVSTSHLPGRIDDER